MRFSRKTGKTQTYKMKNYTILRYNNYQKQIPRRMLKLIAILG